jgi:hypothetical protein
MISTESIHCDEIAENWMDLKLPRTIGGTMHTAMITAQDWIDAPFQGWAGLRWLLARKLAR